MCGCARSPQNGEKIFAYLDLDRLNLIAVLDNITLDFLVLDLNHVGGVGAQKTDLDCEEVISYSQAQTRSLGLGLSCAVYRGRHHEYEFLERKGRGSVGRWTERKG